jgi:hypothetical protein
MMASVDMLMSALLDYTTRTITSSSGGGYGGIGLASCEVLFEHVNTLLNASLRLRAQVEFRSVIGNYRRLIQVNLILIPMPHAPLFLRLFMPASAPRLPAPPTTTAHLCHLPLPFCSFLHTLVPEFSSSICGVIRPQGHAC